MKKSLNTSLVKSHNKDTKKEDAKLLYQALFQAPISRRMAATSIGYPDQTYMVTQYVIDWIEQGKAQVVGTIKCSRSGRFVEAITTNPECFKSTTNNQLEFFN